MPDAGRVRLAAAQAELAASLLAGAPVPPGFEPARVAAAAQALCAKRAREAARALPRLARALPDFPACFAAYARGRPLGPYGPVEDALAFARALRAQGVLPDDGLLELLGAELARRSVLLRAARLAGGGGVVAIKLPGLGERWWRW